jgi:hypothetical protein
MSTIDYERMEIMKDLLVREHKLNLLNETKVTAKFELTEKFGMANAKLLLSEVESKIKGQIFTPFKVICFSIASLVTVYTYGYGLAYIDVKNIDENNSKTVHKIEVRKKNLNPISRYAYQSYLDSSVKYKVEKWKLGY